ncbi:hypothetical protein [Actinomyces procaprae]|uniref:hypothetical protein n=1 Tax=Actinomyces procaprae TaxID=2560010 RepID=UPI0010A23A19|nr:hypothetical protein [Actinomyces procaprae]
MRPAPALPPRAPGPPAERPTPERDAERAAWLRPCRPGRLPGRPSWVVTVRCARALPRGVCRELARTGPEPTAPLLEAPEVLPPDLAGPAPVGLVPPPDDGVRRVPLERPD